MKPAEFVSIYQKALGTQNWKNVEPLVSDDVSVTFSNGKVHLGKHNVKAAFEKNFSMIRNEEYKIERVKWLRKESNFAVYLFEYYWSGTIEGELVSGNGLGTTVLIKENDSWKLLTEHLGKK